jgi:hypothetical protein
MPDELSDAELGIPDELDPNIRAELRKSRSLQRDLEAANAGRAAAEREAAFAKAGVPDSPLAAALAKTYDGENDPASVKAYFEGLGVDLSGKAQNQEDEADLEAQRRLAQVGSAAEPGGNVEFKDAINSTRNVEELMALIASAPEGATTTVEGVRRRIGVPTIE